MEAILKGIAFTALGGLVLILISIVLRIAESLEAIVILLGG